MRLKKPDGKALSRGNDIHPFVDANSLEFLCEKNDCALGAFVSHSKKRPNNLVLLRLCAARAMHTHACACPICARVHSTCAFPVWAADSAYAFHVWAAPRSTYASRYARRFDGHVLDMMEFGVEELFTTEVFDDVEGPAIGAKPCFLFHGVEFEVDPAYAAFKNLFMGALACPPLRSCVRACGCVCGGGGTWVCACSSACVCVRACGCAWGGR